jgi:hypothetical protein
MARMPNGHDWLMRPVLAGHISFNDVYYNDEYNLSDIAIMNEAMDAQNENERRVRKWYKENPSQD